MVHQMGQDGGLVSAILIWASTRATSTARSRRSSRAATALEGLEGPRRGHHKDEVLASAGSRYTYSANTLASTRPASAASTSSPWSA
jgi:coenzyme F420 hydrogenase subunit beta